MFCGWRFSILQHSQLRADNTKCDKYALRLPLKYMSAFFCADFNISSEKEICFLFTTWDINYNP